MSIAPVLQRFVDDELARAPDQIERTISGTQQLLRDSKDAPQNSADRAINLVILEALHTKGATYQRAFLEALNKGVRELLSEQQDGLQTEGPAGSGGLELMDESRVEIDIEISRAMQLIDTTAEWELRELQAFTSTLVGKRHVSADSNPFRPVVYATALWDAASAILPTQVQRATLLRVSAGVTAGLLKNAWAAACTRLEAQGIEPSVYRTVLFAPGTVAGRGSSAPDASRPDSMANLLTHMPGGAAPLDVGMRFAGQGGTAGAVAPNAPAFNPSAEFMQALARLDELLRHLPKIPDGARDSADVLVKRLNLHRAALVASASAPLERQIIELLSRVFDTILSDPQVPSAFVAVLARLQASALRVALSDAAMLASTQHSVWRLLDRIGYASAGHPLANDSRAAALLAYCQSLAEALARAPTPDATLYGRALAKLDAFLDAQLRAQSAAAKNSIETLRQAERRELLEQTLAHRLTEQVAPIRTTPTMRRFMTGPWAKVLAEAMLRHGEQSEITRGYIKLVDEMLWSLQLPDHPQSRQRLISLLPTMLQRLRAGMQSINLAAAEQESVLNELMTIHTEALRPGRADAAAALTPEQIVQRMRDEVLPPSTGHGGFSDSVIDLSSMETVPAELMPNEGALDETAKRVDALVEADRLRLFLHGRWACVQLLWRSEQRLFFLFAGETPGRTHSVTHRALERLSSAGLMQPLEPKTLVQRALDRVMRETGRPDQPAR
jgi:Protein of unknown function (DUF1631)